MISISVDIGNANINCLEDINENENENENAICFEDISNENANSNSNYITNSPDFLLKNKKKEFKNNYRKQILFNKSISVCLTKNFDLLSTLEFYCLYNYHYHHLTSSFILNDDFKIKSVDTMLQIITKDSSFEEFYKEFLYHCFQFYIKWLFNMIIHQKTNYDKFFQREKIYFCIANGITKLLRKYFYKTEHYYPMGEDLYLLYWYLQQKSLFHSNHDLKEIQKQYLKKIANINNDETFPFFVKENPGISYDSFMMRLKNLSFQELYFCCNFLWKSKNNNIHAFYWNDINLNGIPLIISCQYHIGCVILLDKKLIHQKFFNESSTEKYSFKPIYLIHQD